MPAAGRFYRRSGHYGDIHAGMRRTGLPVVDALIAETAR
jgi:hypothetical protein